MLNMHGMRVGKPATVGEVRAKGANVVYGKMQIPFGSSRKVRGWESVVLCEYQNLGKATPDFHIDESGRETNERLSS